MSEIITSAQVKSFVNLDVSFDPSFFSLCITPATEMYIKPILTDALFTLYLADPTDFPALKLYVDPAISYATAFMAYEKDLERNVSNQGIMENNTQYSSSARYEAANRVLAKIKDLEFFYLQRLGTFLIDNADDYPDFDIEKISYEPNFRRFFPI